MRKRMNHLGSQFASIFEQYPFLNHLLYECTHYIILHPITSHYIPLHPITSHYIPLHPITSHFIPLHPITMYHRISTYPLQYISIN